jgi:anti-anti-sigma regulatory factor
MTTMTRVVHDAALFRIPRTVPTGYARDLRASVREALRLGARRLVVDCDAWNRIDVTVLSSLIQCASACREYGASFEVANVSTDMLANVRALNLHSRLGLA